MRILGIDPGLNVTGYGLINGNGMQVALLEAGYIRTVPKDPIHARLEKIHSSLVALLKSTRPEVLILEKLYAHWRHPTTAYVLGHARGMVCLAARQRGVTLIEYPATRIKKAVTGKGHASKMQMQRMVQQVLKLESLPKPADIADALGLAIGHSYMSMCAVPQAKARGSFSCCFVGRSRFAKPGSPLQPSEWRRRVEYDRANLRKDK